MILFKATKFHGNSDFSKLIGPVAKNETSHKLHYLDQNALKWV